MYLSRERMIMMLLSQCSLYLIIILFLYSLLIFLLVAVGVVVHVGRGSRFSRCVYDPFATI